MPNATDDQWSGGRKLIRLSAVAGGGKNKTYPADQCLCNRAGEEKKGRRLVAHSNSCLHDLMPPS